MIRPVALSTQRNAGMSSFEPSRIPAWLAPGLRREVGLPLGSRVRSLRHPARHVRGVAVAHRPAQDRQGEAVDLEEEDPRRVRACRAALALRHPLDDLERVRVVVVRPEDDVEDDGRGRGDERGEQRPAEVVDR